MSSKFVEIAVKNSKEETAKQVAERTQPILRAKLDSKVKAQEAVIIEAEIQLQEADEAVENAQGYVTTNVDTYLKNLFAEMTERDLIAEDLSQASSLLEELQDTLKVFA